MRDALDLRQAVLAVSVLYDVPMEPSDDGVRVSDTDAGPWTTVPWADVHEALAGAEPTSTAGRLRLRDALRGRALMASATPVQLLPLGLPVDHALHPGPGWARERVLGGVLELGLGTVVGEAVIAVRSPDTDWQPVRARLDELAELAVVRLRRDDATRITPMGGCDVLTLLGSRVLREHLSSRDGTGMCALAAPMRSRGWFDLRRIDPAFVAAAAAATDEEHRGVWRPLLVTADEVGLARTPRAPVVLDADLVSSAGTTHR